MITNLDEFKQYVNEVRLPHGYFKVKTMFSLPNGQWDIMFNKDNIIEIDTVAKTVKKWAKVFNSTSGSNASGEWQSLPYPYLELMQPNIYGIFKKNSVKLAAEDTPELGQKMNDIVQFTTTVKKFAKKVEELGLEDSTKLKITVID